MKEPNREVRARKQRGRYGEARLAKKVHGVVVGKSKVAKLPSGKYVQLDVQHPPDVLTDMFAFESKWLKNVPAMLDKVMTQAVRNAPEGFVPVGVIGDRLHSTIYYIFTEKDFLEMHVGEDRSGK